MEQAPISLPCRTRTARATISTWSIKIRPSSYLSNQMRPIFVAPRTSSIVHEDSLTASLHFKSRHYGTEQICEYDSASPVIHNATCCRTEQHRALSVVTIRATDASAVVLEATISKECRRICTALFRGDGSGTNLEVRLCYLNSTAQPPVSKYPRQARKRSEIA